MRRFARFAAAVSMVVLATAAAAAAAAAGPPLAISPHWTSIHRRATAGNRTGGDDMFGLSP
jgi:hypothetical protein